VGRASAEPCSWLAESGDQVEKGGLCMAHVTDSDAVLWGPKAGGVVIDEKRDFRER
jgi:hypothetical protein